MAKTIKQIKNECIEIDVSNIGKGDEIGVWLKDESRFLYFTDKNSVELYYEHINLKELLRIYSQYMGLNCIKGTPDEECYSISVLDLIDIL